MEAVQINKHKMRMEIIIVLQTIISNQVIIIIKAHQTKSTTTTQGNNGYVVPYHGTNAVNVARSLTRDNVNQSEALKQLPNFQTALDIAKQEANLYGNHNKTYNDYGIEGNNGNYRYVFSFKDPQQNGVYSIVTVNSQGQPVVVDPAYGK